MRKIYLTFVLFLSLFLHSTSVSVGETDMSNLDVIKVSGNVYEIKGRLLSVIDGTGTLIKIFVPESTPIYLNNDETSFDTLNSEDKVDVFTHNKNVALAIDIEINVDVTPTPEPQDNEGELSDAEEESLGTALGVASSFNTAGMRLSLAAAGVFLGIVLLAFGLPWIASLIGNQIEAKKDQESN